jgi:hypothetical protein
MINVETAALIAQVYPVGLVIVGLEIRNAPTLYAAKKPGWWILVILSVILIVGLAGGCWSVLTAVQAVSNNEPITGWAAFVVDRSGHALWMGSTILLLGILADRLGLLERMSAKAAARTAGSPRQTRRMVEFVEAHHPGAGRPNAD